MVNGGLNDGVFFVAAFVQAVAAVTEEGIDISIITGSWSEAFRISLENKRHNTNFSTNVTSYSFALIAKFYNLDHFVFVLYFSIFFWLVSLVKLTSCLNEER